MCSVDQRIDTAPFQLADDFSDGENQCCTAGHMINESKAGTRGNRCEDRFNNLVDAAHREWNPRHNQPGTSPACRLDQGVVASIIIVIGREKLLLLLRNGDELSPDSHPEI